jgi:hypothetical protein
MQLAANLLLHEAQGTLCKAKNDNRAMVCSVQSITAQKAPPKRRDFKPPLITRTQAKLSRLIAAFVGYTI